MKKKAVFKEFFVELKRSFPRFISLFFIVALGVAFFSGIRSTEPDMELSADAFYDQSRLMDIRILSSLGLTEKDVNVLQGIDEVKTAEGAYSKDMLCQAGEKQLTVKIMSLPGELNQIVVKEGRLPENTKECIADTAFLNKSGYQVGDTIQVKTGDDTQWSDALKNNTFTIVGTCVTSYYLSLERGNTNIGNGTLDSFLMIPGECFSYDFYTELYVSIEGAESLLCYSNQYEEKVKAVTKKIENQIKEKQEQARYDEIKGEAQQKVYDAKKELKEAKKEADEKLGEAKQKLEDIEKEIQDGEKKITDREKELKKGKKEVKEGEKKIQEAEYEMKKNEKEITSKEILIQKSEKKLKEAETQYQIQVTQYEKGAKEVEKAKKTLDQTSAQLTQGETQIALALEFLKKKEESGQFSQEELKMAKEEIEKETEKLEAGRNAYMEGMRKWQQTKGELDRAKKALEEARQQLSQSEQTIKVSKQRISDGKNQIENAKIELKKKRTELKEAKKQIEKGEKKLEKAKQKIQDAKEAFTEGKGDYLGEKKKADTKIKEAEQEIADAEEKIKEIKKAKWYVLDRNSIQTYVEYKQDSERIGAVGDVFPIIFFLVASLVSLTTMTRMVEEQRTQIGTLKALGYSKGVIAGKYIGYAFLAILGGSLFGGVVGCKVFPWIIIHAYTIMYQNLEIIITPFNFSFTLIAAFISFFCVLGAVVLACWKELAASPAELMRPKAPKQGKRVLLERIPFLWKRLNFTKKATIRNLFRYKKRFFMTIFGIAGCMALMLVGFGLKDSIFSIVEIQYGRVHNFDLIMELKDGLKRSEKEELGRKLNQFSCIEEYPFQYQGAVELNHGSKKKNINLIVIEDSKKIENYYGFQERVGQKKISLTNSGAILSEKAAKLLNVKQGDTVLMELTDKEEKEVRVEGICENYVRNYIYMTREYYQSLYGEEPDCNQLLLSLNNSTEEEKEELAETLLQYEEINSVTITSKVKKQFEEMLGNLDIVIMVLIISAGGLAFIVLFNLNNISINERKRELATLKVLGFYDIEVSEYVYRENIILTILGIFVGMILGAFLHHYVIITCEIDMIMFGRKIEAQSYVYSAVLTCLFAVLINASMHFKLKRIDMASSLKSVE